MPNLIQFFQDSVGALSASRLVFIFGSFIILSMAVLQFFGVGTLATALYGILATLVSGGYATAKYMDTKDFPSDPLLEDASRESSLDETN